MNEDTCPECDELIHHNEAQLRNRAGFMCHKRCAEARARHEHVLARAIEAHKRMVETIGKLERERQAPIFECCMKLLTIARAYGLDSRYAISLLSAGVACGHLKLQVEDDKPKIIIPDGKIIH